MTLNLKIVDQAGHAGLEVALRSASWSAKTEQHVLLFAYVQAAAIDRFVEELNWLGESKRHDAFLSFDGAINRA